MRYPTYNFTNFTIGQIMVSEWLNISQNLTLGWTNQQLADEKSKVNNYCIIIGSSQQTTRKHSSRMRNARLPTVRVSLATRCHYQLGEWGYPQVNKFEQVSRDGQQMSLVGGEVPQVNKFATQTFVYNFK